MNDEATRKYLHGISRLIQATQRLRPADPSRSSNFNAVEVCDHVLFTCHNHQLLCTCHGDSQIVCTHYLCNITPLIAVRCLVQHAGLGAKSGHQKKRLLEIKQNGEEGDAPVAAPLAPEFFNNDGSVQVPRAWGNMLRAEAQKGTQGS